MQGASTLALHVALRHSQQLPAYKITQSLLKEHDVTSIRNHI